MVDKSRLCRGRTSQMDGYYGEHTDPSSDAVPQYVVNSHVQPFSILLYELWKDRATSFCGGILKFSTGSVFAAGRIAGHSWGQWQNKDEFIKGLQDKSAKWKSGDISDLHVATFGANTAVDHYTFTYDADISGEHRVRTVICSDTWVNDSGTWKSASTHCSLV